MLTASMTAINKTTVLTDFRLRHISGRAKRLAMIGGSAIRSVQRSVASSRWLSGRRCRSAVPERSVNLLPARCNQSLKRIAKNCSGVVNGNSSFKNRHRILGPDLYSHRQRLPRDPPWGASRILLRSMHCWKRLAASDRFILLHCDLRHAHLSSGCAGVGTSSITDRKANNEPSMG
jgi:hypothetical protein